MLQDKGFWFDFLRQRGASIKGKNLRGLVLSILLCIVIPIGPYTELVPVSAGNDEYLKGRQLEERGESREALEVYQRIVSRNTALTSYALWHQAKILRSIGQHNDEQKVLRKFVTQYPSHLLHERALDVLTDSYFKTGNYEDAIWALRQKTDNRRVTAARIAEAQLEMGKDDLAKAGFEAVLSNGSMDDASLRSVEALDRISPPSSESDTLRRARVYQFNRHFTEAAKHWKNLVDKYPQNTARREALFQTGRGYFWLENFEEAAKWYDRAHDEFPYSDEGEQGYYYVGHCYQALNDADRAIERYEDYLKKYPSGSYVGYAYLNAIDTLRSAKRYDDALRWVMRAQSRDGFIANTAFLKQGLIRLNQERYSDALAAFSSLKARSLSTRGLTASTSSSEVAFMHAYTLEMMGRYDDAISGYLALKEVREGAQAYYARQASGRLKRLGDNPQAQRIIQSQVSRYLSDARSLDSQGNASGAKNAVTQALRFNLKLNERDEMLKILRSAYAKLPGYKLPSLNLSPANDRSTIAGELIAMGLYDEGAAELAKASPPMQTLAYYCSKGSCADRTINYSEPILNSLPDDYRYEVMPEEWAEIFFPYPFKTDLMRYATERGVDPLFTLSIARQESRYNPRVKSPVAARGMMQFISDTANQIAAQLKVQDFNQDDLYDPEVAINFGTQYLGNLLNEFGSYQAAAAAYNGSESSVRKWIDRAGSRDVDRFTVEILKKETKEYTIKVSNNYAAYKAIY